MGRFVEGEDRRQGVLLPEFLDDYVSDENPVRVIDVFVDELNLVALGFAGVIPEATGRPSYHPGMMLKIYVYGYINQITSSRRLEKEASRNVEMMWLTQRLAPRPRPVGGHGRQGSGGDGVETLDVLADRGYFSGEEVLACEPLGVTPYVPKPLTSGAAAEGRFGKPDFVYLPDMDANRCPAGQRLPRYMTTVERGQTLHRYCLDNASCAACALKAQCTPSPVRRVARWEHEAVIDAMLERLDRRPDAMRVRRATVEHPFGTLKAWMGATHFKNRTLDKVKTEMSLHILAYNLKRVIAILGPGPLMAAMRA